MYLTDGAVPATLCQYGLEAAHGLCCSLLRPIQTFCIVLPLRAAVGRRWVCRGGLLLVLQAISSGGALNVVSWLFCQAPYALLFSKETRLQ